MGILLAGGAEHVQSTLTYARPTTDCTLSMWLRLDDSSANRRPFGHDTNFEARTAANNILTLDYFGSTSGTATITVGTYHHLSIVCDITGALIKVHLDGVEVLNQAATFGTAGTAVMQIGSSPGGASQGWLGALDDIRIYNRALTLGESQTIHGCRGTDGLIEDLEHWYPMDEGVEGAVVSTIYDHIGGIDCGAVTGTPAYNYDAGIKRRRLT